MSKKTDYVLMGHLGQETAHEVGTERPIQLELVGLPLGPSRATEVATVVWPIAVQ